MNDFTIKQLDKALAEKDDTKFRMHIELLRDMLSDQQLNAPTTQYKPPLARSNVKDGQVTNSASKMPPASSQTLINATTGVANPLSMVGEDFSQEALAGPSPMIDAYARQTNKRMGNNGKKKS